MHVILVRVRVRVYMYVMLSSWVGWLVHNICTLYFLYCVIQSLKDLLVMLLHLIHSLYMCLCQWSVTKLTDAYFLNNYVCTLCTPPLLSESVVLSALLWSLSGHCLQGQEGVWSVDQRTPGMSYGSCNLSTLPLSLWLAKHVYDVRLFIVCTHSQTHTHTAPGFDGRLYGPSRCGELHLSGGRE